VILGTTAGGIECHSFVNGTLGKNIRGHSSDISCMLYCKEARTRVACAAFLSLSVLRRFHDVMGAGYGVYLGVVGPSHSSVG
jgi:hypothetical protein